MKNYIVKNYIELKQIVWAAVIYRMAAKLTSRMAKFPTLAQNHIAVDVFKAAYELYGAVFANEVDILVDNGFDVDAIDDMCNTAFSETRKNHKAHTAARILAYLNETGFKAGYWTYVEKLRKELEYANALEI